MSNDIKVSDLPACPLRVGRVINNKAVVCCNTAEIDGNECIACSEYDRECRIKGIELSIDESIGNKINETIDKILYEIGQMSYEAFKEFAFAYLGESEIYDMVVASITTSEQPLEWFDDILKLIVTIKKFDSEHNGGN